MRSLKFIGSIAAAWVLSGCSYALVEPGHRGLLFDPGSNGVKQEVLGPGSYHLSTFCLRACPRVDDFDITFSTRREVMRTTSGDGLQMDLTFNVIYRPIDTELYELDTQIGPNYYDEVVGPEFRSAARGILAHHSYAEVISKDEKIEDEIEESVKRRIHGKHIDIASITIASISYAPEIAAQNRARIVAEQEALRQKSMAEAEDQRKKTAIQHQQEQARMQADSDAEQARAKSQAENLSKQHELEVVKEQAAIDKTKAEGDAHAEVASAKGEAEATKLLARAHAEENRAQTMTVTPLTVQMHAYDALGKLGGEGTTVLLGDWSRVPNFLFPHAGAFLNMYPSGYAAMTPNKPVSAAPSKGDVKPAAAPPPEFVKPSPAL